MTLQTAPLIRVDRSVADDCRVSREFCADLGELVRAYVLARVSAPSLTVAVSGRRRTRLRATITWVEGPTTAALADALNVDALVPFAGADGEGVIELVLNQRWSWASALEALTHDPSLLTAPRIVEALRGREAHGVHPDPVLRSLWLQQLGQNRLLHDFETAELWRTFEQHRDAVKALHAAL